MSQPGNKTASTFERGRANEEIALQYLIGRGFQRVERNFRWRGGEIDLVMLATGSDAASRSPVLVFVEVRSGKKSSSPWLRSSITFSKQKRLMRTAEVYFWRRRLKPMPFRFDLLWVEDGICEHWPNVWLGFS